MTDLEYRSVEIRAINDETREITGIAVPWDTEARIGNWYTEKFERGSVQDSDNALLFWMHNEPIGKITRAEDTESGWEITATISKTTRGDDAYALAKDGTVKEFSIGFEPIEHREENEDGDVLHIIRTKVRVREVSLVPFGAYGENATVSQVRAADNPTPESESQVTTTENASNADLIEVRSLVEEIDRKVDSLATSTATPEPVLDTRSAGQFLKAVIDGSEETRDYTGSTSADTVVKHGWVGDLTRIVDEAAPLTTLFATGTLPSEGNSIEFAELTANSVAVEKQTAEGADLPFGKITQATRTAAVGTYGGYSQLTRQQIERSSVNVLDATLRAQAIATGKALNTALRTQFTTTHAAQVTATNVVEIPDTGVTYKDWLAAAVDAAEKFEALGLPMSALVVNTTTFKSLLTLTAEDGRPVFLVTGAGSNNVGSLDVRGLSGDLANIPVILAPGLTTQSAFVNKDALRLYRSPVVRLQDENVINLSKDFSVYTYAAVAPEIPSAIVPLVEAE